MMRPNFKLGMAEYRFDIDIGLARDDGSGNQRRSRIVHHKRCCFRNLWVLFQNLVDPVEVDLGAPKIDNVVYPSLDKQQSVCIESSEVAGIKPPIAKFFRSRFIVAMIFGRRA